VLQTAIKDINCDIFTSGMDAIFKRTLTWHEGAYLLPVQPLSDETFYLFSKPYNYATISYAWTVTLREAE
jgi:hypothetical protein